MQTEKVNKTYHCLFEQSGTFKNEFKKLGYQAYDYDILNQFGETDYVMDLFQEIEDAYNGGGQLLNKLGKDDEIIAFFPCTRFENKIQLWFKGECISQKNWSALKKLEYAMNLHKELDRNYQLISKLVIVCTKNNIPLIIENPYTQPHYLTSYWCIRPKVIDKNRRDRGDYMQKPTQYWFINREPSNNLIFEPIAINEKRISDKMTTVMRSMISKDYARRFIQEFVI